jgi:hypothetical protein
MSLERCCCVFATKKVGLTPLKAIAPIAIANGIFVKRKIPAASAGICVMALNLVPGRLRNFSVSSCATLTT